LAKFDEGPLNQRAFRFTEGGKALRIRKRLAQARCGRRTAGLLHVPDRRYTLLDTTAPHIPQCSTANAKIVSNENGRKKFLLNLFSFDEAAPCTLLSRRGCDKRFAV
jgi:hypothetical protein